MVPPNTNEFTAILEESFSRAEGALLLHKPPQVAVVLPADCDVVFASQTQAYREVLLGCLLVRLTDPSKDVHDGLLARSSGGFFPVILVLAMIDTLVGRFSLEWIMSLPFIWSKSGLRPSSKQRDTSPKGMTLTS